MEFVKTIRVKRSSQIAIKKPADAPATAKPAKAAIKAVAAPKASKPATPKHTFTSDYDGPSAGLNKKTSRTVIDFTRFAQYSNYPMTQRDVDEVAALRKVYGSKPFARLNMDAGVLRRLGERECIEHISGDGVSADTTFRLTNKGLGKAEPRAKKAA